MSFTWSLADADGTTEVRGTAVTVLCENLPKGVRPEDNEMGSRSSLEKLAALLERTDRSTRDLCQTMTPVPPVPFVVAFVFPMDIENIVLCCAVVLSTGGIAFARWQWPGLRQPPSLDYLGVAWILVTGLLFLVGILSANAWARHHIRAQISDLIEQQAIVYIDGVKAESPDRILRGLLSLGAVAGHHSYPLNRRTLLIRSKNSEIELVIAPDSERMDECWVYWPSFSRTLDVGHTESSELSAVLRGK